MSRFVAKYRHSVKDFFNNTFIHLIVRCFILSETEKSYFIELIEKTPSRWPGERFWVRKKSVERSYYDEDSRKCVKYDLDVRGESCAACLEKCLRKEYMIKMKRN